MFNEITILVGSNLNIYLFNRAGVVEGSARTTRATPIEKWLFREKPRPGNENAVGVK